MKLKADGILARHRLHTVLDMALAASPRCGQKMCEQGNAPTYLSHGRRKPDLGCAAHSWRADDARLRYLGEDSASLDAESTENPGAGEALGGIPEQPQRGDCGDGLLHRPDPDVWYAPLLLRHCT